MEAAKATFSGKTSERGPPQAACIRLALGLAWRAVDVRIEPEGRSDVGLIRDLLRRAFHHHQSVADLVELIRASPQYVPELALVARAGPDVAGFVMLSHADVMGIDGRRHDVLTLSPLAVAPSLQRQGIGSSLVRAGLAAADATGAGLVVLEGSPTFYGRLGFRFAADFGIAIDLPDWAPREAAQVCPLQSYDAAVRGKLQYPPAFSVLD